MTIGLCPNPFDAFSASLGLYLYSLTSRCYYHSCDRIRSVACSRHLRSLAGEACHLAAGLTGWWAQVDFESRSALIAYTFVEALGTEFLFRPHPRRFLRPEGAILPPVLPAGGLKWTRTTDLVLIRHAL